MTAYEGAKEKIERLEAEVERLRALCVGACVWCPRAKTEPHMCGPCLIRKELGSAAPVVFQAAGRGEGK
jgi:hypothetical protein